MKKYILLLIIPLISFGKLIPTPLVTYPEPTQRFTGTIADTILETHLFGQCYGISFVKIRNTGLENWLGVISDPVLDDLVYILGVDSLGERYSKFISGFDDWQNPQYFDRPMGVACDSTIFNSNAADYFVYTADCAHNRLVRSYYNSNDEKMYFYDYMLEGTLFEPEDVACVTIPGGGSYLVIADTRNHCIKVVGIYSNLTYNVLKTYGTEGEGVGQFRIPTSVTIVACKDSLEYYRIYVVDQRNFRIVSLLYNTMDNSIVWERVFEDNTMQSVFTSVTSNPYYCVYVTDVMKHKIWVFTPGLEELLYTYGSYGYGENQFICPYDLCIYQDEIAVTESWSNRTGIQYFKIIPEIREFYPEPGIFDATEDSVKINFRVDETAQYLTMTVADRTLFEDSLFVPERYSVWWDGRDSSGQVVLPDTYEIKIYCQGQCLATTTVRVKGTKVQYYASGHWQTTGNPYVLVGDCRVPNGDNLTIDPGVLIMGHDTSSVLSDGGLITAIGTDADSIVFTVHRKIDEDSTYPGMWKGLVINNSESQLEYCAIKYAGSDTSSILCSASPLIKHCEIKSSENYGLFCNNANALPTIDSCHFLENNAAPMRISAKGIPFISGNTFENNTDSVIEIIACDINEDLVWHPEKLSYRVIGSSLSLVGNGQDTVKLSILPGVELQFAQNAIFNIGGSYPVVLDAVGKPESLVVFTSDVDTLSWKGFKFSGKTIYDTLQLNNCSIEQAGSSLAAMEIFNDTGIVNIDSCKIYKSKKYGLWLNDKRRCNLSITNTIFEEDSIPARCLFTGCFGFGEGNEYFNNTINKIEVYPCSLKYNMSISPQVIPYWFKKSGTNKEFKVYVDADSSYTPTLTIQPGTKIAFDDSTILRIGRPSYWDSYLYRWFHFRGRLACEGTESDTIRLTLTDAQTLRANREISRIATATASPRL